MSRNSIRLHSENRPRLVKGLVKVLKLLWTVSGSFYLIHIVTYPFWSSGDLASLRIPPSAVTNLILIAAGTLPPVQLLPTKMRVKCTLPVSRPTWAIKSWQISALMPFALMAIVAAFTVPPYAIWKSNSEYSGIEYVLCVCAPGFWTQIWLLVIGGLKLGSVRRAKRDPTLAMLLLATPVVGIGILAALASRWIEAEHTPEPGALLTTVAIYSLLALLATYTLRGHLIDPLIEVGKASFVAESTDLMEFILPAPSSTPPPLLNPTPPDTSANTTVPLRTRLSQLPISWTLCARTLAGSSIMALCVLLPTLAVGLALKLTIEESDFGIASDPVFFRMLMVCEWFAISYAVISSSNHWRPLRTLPLTTQNLAFQLAAFVWVAIAPFCLASVVLILCSFRWEYILPLFSFQVGTLGIAVLIQGFSPHFLSGRVVRQNRELLCLVGCITYISVTATTLAQPTWTTSLLTMALGVLAGCVGLYVALPRAITNNNDVYKLTGNRTGLL